MPKRKLVICTYCHGDCEVWDSRGRQPIDGPKMKTCPVCGGRGATVPELADQYDNMTLGELERMHEEDAAEARFESERDGNDFYSDF